MYELADRPRSKHFGGKAPAPMPWRPLPFMEEFLLEKEAEDKAPSYISSVHLGLAHFAVFAETENIKHPDEITRAHILRFQAYLQKARTYDGKPFSLSYRQQLMKYNRTWINWMAELGHIEHNPWVRIKIGSVAKKPRPLEDDEIELLFDVHKKQAFTLSPFHYHRRELILVLLYGWGLRVHELASLTVTAMDMRLDWVTVRNKGGGTKVLPYGEEMKTVTQRWLRTRGSKANRDEDALLVDKEGKRLSEAMIHKIIKDLGTRAGVNINPHRLRDTFGTTMLDNDVEVERIMKMMGHTNRKQTLAYARVNDHKIKESHDRVFNPLIDKLLGGKLP